VDRYRYKGDLSVNWKGGRRLTTDGYVEIWLSDDDPLLCMARFGTQRILEHRYVMAQILGRPLEPRETVHHINGVKTDNTLDNLQIRQGNHGSGVVHVCRHCGSTDISATTVN
jgi:hypothetical protein